MNSISRPWIGIEPLAITAKQITNLVGKENDLELFHFRQTSIELEQCFTDTGPFVWGVGMQVHQFHTAGHIDEKHDALTGQRDAFKTILDCEAGLSQLPGEFLLVAFQAGHHVAGGFEFAFQRFHSGIDLRQFVALLGRGIAKLGRATFCVAQLGGEVIRACSAALVTANSAVSFSSKSFARPFAVAKSRVSFESRSAESFTCFSVAARSFDNFSASAWLKVNSTRVWSVVRRAASRSEIVLVN